MLHGRRGGRGVQPASEKQTRRQRKEERAEICERLLGQEMERLCVSEDKSGRTWRAYVLCREGEGEQEPRFEDAFWRNRLRECAWAKARAEESGDSCII